MATLYTLLGAVLAPAATVYLSSKVVSNKPGEEDTVNRSFEKTAGVGFAVALAGWGIANYAGGKGSKAYDFGTGALLGGGVTGGLALGARLTTTTAQGAVKVPAKVAGLPGYAYSQVAGLPAGHDNFGFRRHPAYHPGYMR